MFRIVGAATTAPTYTQTSISGTSPLSVSITVPANGGVLAGAMIRANAAAYPFDWVGVTEGYDEVVEGGTQHGGGVATSGSGYGGLTVEASWTGSADIGTGHDCRVMAPMTARRPASPTPDDQRRRSTYTPA